jgi:hypothetical protein
MTTDLLLEIGKTVHQLNWDLCDGVQPRKKDYFVGDSVGLNVYINLLLSVTGDSVSVSDCIATNLRMIGERVISQ